MTGFGGTTQRADDVKVSTVKPVFITIATDNFNYSHILGFNAHELILQLGKWRKSHSS